MQAKQTASGVTVKGEDLPGLPLEPELATLLWEPQLVQVLLLAAHVGDASGDHVFISYSSLMIALLWSDDADLQWLHEFVAKSGVNRTLILRHRGAREEQRTEVIERARSGVAFTRTVEDSVSRSAATIFRDAATIAAETGDAGIGVRHVLAAYVFRNPPSHDRDLKHWGFDQQALRRAFALFATKRWEDKLDQWADILKGYLPEQLATTDETHDGRILGSYSFESGGLMVLRVTESFAATLSASTLASEHLLRVLLGLGSDTENADPDCKDLAMVLYGHPDVESKLASTTDSVEPVLSARKAAPVAEAFGANGTSLSVSRGLKRVLDRARTVALSTSNTDSIAIRQLIASIIVENDSTAFSQLVESGLSMTVLRRELLRRFTRRWMGDDGGEWHLVLVGSTSPTLAGFESDDPARGSDRLDVTRYASAFATVIAADSVEPPLSIGIFGDWGSGKSFFMRLMREQTERACAYTDVNEEGRRLFCRRVVPIEFNAWHYAETELWASLVQTILEELGVALRGESIDDALKKLTLVQEAREEGERELQRAQAQQDEAATTLQDVTRQHNEREQDLKDTEGRDLAAAFGQELVAGDDVEEALQAAQTYLGLEHATEAKRNVTELIQIAEQARHLGPQIRSVWRWAQRPDIRTKVAWFVGGAAVLGGLAVYAWDRLADGLGWLDVALAEVSIVAVALVGRVAPLLAKAKSALDRIGGVRTRIETLKAARLAEHTEVIEAARCALQRGQDDLKAAQQAVDRANADVSRAEAEVKDSTSTRRIARLIERRLAGCDYEKHLGIVSTIREDFQKLSDWFAEYSSTESDAARQNPELEPVDRIVLYIDDLDRCPSDKVVSVLEAIHLMLAFPLFVVVVGVDIRWAETSLHEHYPQHLDPGLQSDSTDGDSSTTAQGASALDYIEKIFQIPFWLPPMEEEASRNMLAGMVPLTEPLPDAASSAAGSQGTQAGGGTPTTGAVTSTPASAGPKEPTVAAGAESLVIDPYEREFMLSLAGAVGKSPRRLKRFVNTYRVLKASCDALERETFVVDKGKQGTYRAAMTLLAITTGAPRRAIAILRKLNESNNDAGTLDGFVEWVTKLATDRASIEIRYAEEAIRVYQAACAAEPGLQDLRYWATRVARFSFRSGWV